MATGTVKFFNDAKGFGFIAPDDGGADIFVHVSAVQRAGLEGLSEGDQLSFDLEQDRKTGKAAAVDLQLLSAGAPTGRRTAPSFAPRPRAGGRQDRPAGGTISGAGRGVVKWFNPTKGFVFIQPNDGGGDVFVHISAVEQAGLRGLQDGQALAYELEVDRRSGKSSAVNLRLD